MERFPTSPPTWWPGRGRTSRASSPTCEPQSRRASRCSARCPPCRRRTRTGRSRSTRGGGATRPGSTWRRSGRTWGSRIPAVKRLLSVPLAALALACAGRCRAGPAARAVGLALPTLVSTDELARWQAEGPVVLLDVRTDVFAYLKGHLPGAEYLNTETLRASEGGIPTRLLSGRRVPRAVLPARRRVRPARGDLQRRRIAQHRRDVSSPGCWPASGTRRCTCSTAASSSGSSSSGRWCSPIRGIPVTRFPIGHSGRRRPSLDGSAGAPSAAASLLVDARPPDQYAGEAGAQMRRGHIPGAINHYWQDDLTQEGFGHVWKRPTSCGGPTPHRGSRPDKNIIAYCNSATEASHVYFTLRYLLGYPRVRIYVGSWTEWAEDAALPVVDGGEAIGGRRGRKREQLVPDSPSCFSHDFLPGLSRPLRLLRPSSHRDPAPELSRPPDLAAAHDPLDRVQVTDVVQRVLAEHHEIGVVARLDGADPAARLAADGPRGVARGRQERRRRATGRSNPRTAVARRTATRDRRPGHRPRGRCRR